MRHKKRGKIRRIQDGLAGDYRLLAIKSMLDGFASLAFASSLGIGVAFSTLTILIYQGGLSLLASTPRGGGELCPKPDRGGLLSGTPRWPLRSSLVS
jgi:hypothetical protein